MSLSSQISHYVRMRYIEPARRERRSTLEIRAGEVHEQLGLRNRVASVCTTLESHKFQQENQLHLIRTSGPKSGRSTTVVFAYRLLNPVPVEEIEPQPSRGLKLESLWGICADTFRELGGGEEFLRREREWGPDAWERYEAEEEARRKEGMRR